MEENKAILNDVAFKYVMNVVRKTTSIVHKIKIIINMSLLKTGESREVINYGRTLRMLSTNYRVILKVP